MESHPAGFRPLSPGRAGRYDFRSAHSFRLAPPVAVMTEPTTRPNPIARLISLILLGGLLVSLALLFYQVLSPFLLPLFLAAVLAMLTQPLHRWIGTRVGPRPTLAAGLTTAVVLGSLMLPLSLGTLLAARQMYTVGTRVLQGDDWRQGYDFVAEKLRVRDVQRWIHDVTGEPLDEAGLEQELQNRLREWSGTVLKKTWTFAGVAPSVVGGLVTFCISALTFVVAYYYFLADGPMLLQGAQRLIPVQREYQQQLLRQFEQAVRGVVVATFAAALGQGLATGVGMQICGARQFFILSLVATLTALVPVLGTWLVWGPYALWLGLHEGDWVRASLLAAYGGVGVGLLDNVIRSYVLHSNVKLHPLLAFVSVLGGIQVLGLWGVFIGPVVASCLHALMKIVNTELLHMGKRSWSLPGLVDPDPPPLDNESLDHRTPVRPETSLAPSVVDGSVGGMPRSESNQPPGASEVPQPQAPSHPSTI